MTIQSSRTCVPSDLVDNITECILPGVHLDHSDTSDHLVHHLDTSISDTSCLQSDDKFERDRL